MIIPAKTAEQRKAEREAWANGQQKDVGGVNKPKTPAKDGN
jgi:hypothetical protein